MLAALVLAAGALSARTPTTDQRISLLEARQMLQSQTLWTLQAAVPPEAAKALNDLDLHLQQDRERDEKMAQLEGTIAVLEQRLQAVELLLGDRPLAEGGPMRVAPPPVQAGPTVLKANPRAKGARAKHAQAKPASPPGRSSRLSAQQP